MSYDHDNIFARILRGEIPCDRVFENDHVLAFRDIRPQRKVHVLVIPKGAYVSAQDFAEKASAAEITAFYQAVAGIARDQGLTGNGYRMIANIGEHGHQEVPHYHIHLLGGEPVGQMVSAVVSTGA